VICALRREDFQGISAYPSDEDLEPAQITSSNEAYFLEGRFLERFRTAAIRFDHKIFDHKIAIGVPVAWYPTQTRIGDPFIARIGRSRNSASGCMHSQTDWNAGVYVRNPPSTDLCLPPLGLRELSGCRPHGVR
jgi:hypothetical protein